MVTPARFERAAPRLGIWCSIRLSYGVPGRFIAARSFHSIQLFWRSNREWQRGDRHAIVDQLRRPLGSLPEADRAFIDALLGETLDKTIIAGRIRERFQARRGTS